MYATFDSQYFSLSFYVYFSVFGLFLVLVSFVFVVVVVGRGLFFRPVDVRKTWSALA